MTFCLCLPLAASRSPDGVGSPVLPREREAASGGCICIQYRACEKLRDRAEDAGGIDECEMKKTAALFRMGGNPIRIPQ
jgi:hypothetical protein